MKTIRNAVLIGVVAVLVVGLVAFALPALEVQAQGTTPTTPAPKGPAAPQANGAVAIARLEKIYQAEQKALERQGTNLSNADRLITRAENIVQRLKARGLDTSKLEAALKDFQADLAQAKTYHDQAAGILSTHAGFDDQGKVTDRQQAHKTVLEAGKALRDAHRAIFDGRTAVQDAIQDLQLQLPEKTK